MTREWAGNPGQRRTRALLESAYFTASASNAGWSWGLREDLSCLSTR